MVPKQRKTKSKRDQRRVHLRLKKQNLTRCSHCLRPILPHRVCPFCGYYKDKQVIDVMARLNKKERKAKQKEEEKRQETLSKPRPKKKPLSLEQLSQK